MPALPTLPAPPTTRTLRHNLQSRASVCFHSERNILSATVNTAVVVVACVAFFHPRWFWMEGGGCNTNTLSIYLFIFAGQYMQVAEDAPSPTSSSSSSSSPSSSSSSSSSFLSTSPSHGASSYIFYIKGKELRCCVTPHVVALLQVVISLVFVMVCSALLQLTLDLVGPTFKPLRCLRRNSVASIIAVWVCVAGVGVCYCLTVLLEALQQATKPSQGPFMLERVHVRFDVGFYYFILAGGLSVVAVGCSWLRPTHLFEAPDTLLEDCSLDGLDTLIGPGDLYAYPCLMDREPPPPLEGNPPPPYSP